MGAASRSWLESAGRDSSVVWGPKWSLFVVVPKGPFGPPQPPPPPPISPSTKRATQAPVAAGTAAESSDAAQGGCRHGLLALRVKRYVRRLWVYEQRGW